MTWEKIGFVGGGRVARILLNGFKNSGMFPPEVLVYDTQSDVSGNLKREFPEIETVDHMNDAAKQEMVFLSVHPPSIADCLDTLKTCLRPDAVLVSLAPKPDCAALSGKLGGFSRIIRTLPNAPAFVNKGFNPVVFYHGIDKTLKQRFFKQMEGLGKMPEVKDEDLAAYAVITAMGPTYLWFQLNELLNLAVSFGLARERAAAAILEMVGGSAEIMLQSGLTPEQVMDLIPVKPLAGHEAAICGIYKGQLTGMYNKLKA